MVIVPDGHKLCSGECGLIKSLDEFGWKDKKAGRKREKCQICHNKETRAYKEKNREELRAQGKTYYSDHKRQLAAAQKEARAKDPERFRIVQRRSKRKHHDRVITDTRYRRDRIRSRGGKITAQEQRVMYARYDWRCVRCGKQKPLSFDHVDPDGPGDVFNGQPLCRSCNSWKWQRIKDESREDLDFRRDPRTYAPSPYDLRPDLPIGTVDLLMGDLPVPDWAYEPPRKLLLEQTEKLCLGPKHDKNGVMLSIKEFPIRSKTSGRIFRKTYCTPCLNELQRLAAEKKRGRPAKKYRLQPEEFSKLPLEQRKYRICYGILHPDGLLLNIDKFNARTSKYGKPYPYNVCHDCKIENARILAAKKREVNPPHIPFTQRKERICKGPLHKEGVILPIEDFPLVVNRRYHFCRLCKNEYLKQWRAGDKTA